MFELYSFFSVMRCKSKKKNVIIELETKKIAQDENFKYFCQKFYLENSDIL